MPYSKSVVFGIAFSFVLLALSGCDEAPSSTTKQTSLSVTMKSLNFSWDEVSGTDHYRILVNADGNSGFTAVPGAENIRTTQHSIEIGVHLIDWISARYLVEACDANNSQCSTVSERTLTAADSIAATGYFKPSNTGANDHYGYSVAVSADGTTIAVGSHHEDDSGTGVTNPSNNDAEDAGAVYVFALVDGNWIQQAYLKASNAESDDIFGVAIALSDDGNTLAVGAEGEDSSSTGVNSTPNNSSAHAESGAVYVFVRNTENWSQEAYIKASNPGPFDYFGRAVALSGDGHTLAVGAPYEDSSSTTINDSPDEAASASGAAYVFTRSGTDWQQQAFIKATQSKAEDLFGGALALSSDGNTLAVGADDEESSSSGVNSSPIYNDSFTNTGAVYVFTRNGNNWSQDAYIKSSGVNNTIHFGKSVALNDQGDVLVSTSYNSSTAAAFVFVLQSGNWVQQDSVTPFDDTSGSSFGQVVTLNGEGNIFAVGASSESRAGAGVQSQINYENLTFSGAVYIFSRNNDNWQQRSYLKAPNAGANDYFGRSVSLSGDGELLVVGAFREDSDTTGIGSTPNDNAASAGAAYLY